MSKSIVRKEILHKASTNETLICLISMPSCSKILFENLDKNKAYIDFLKWLIEVYFLATEHNFSIKTLASNFKVESSKMTKWIHEIYKDIFNLNFNRPELFQKNGIGITLCMRHYDNSCLFYTSVQILPREFEGMELPFVVAKVGTSNFWIKKIEHKFEDNRIEIFMWLVDGFVNRYREFALDKALFQGIVLFGDEYDKHSFEIDKILIKAYK